MFGKNANNKGAEVAGKRISSKTVKMNRKNMKSVISIAICLLFIATALSSAVGETENVTKNWDLDHETVNEEHKEVNGNNRMSFQSANKYIWSDKGDNLDNWVIIYFDLYGMEKEATLKFWTQYEIASNSTDFGYVKISSDGRDTWTTLAALQGSQQDWIEMELDLSPWAGEFILAFQYTTGPDSVSEGWCIDSITVEEDGVVRYSEDFEEYEVGSKWGDWVIAGKGPIDIEYITIGTGQDCFSFAIIADPQSSTAKLAEAVTEINTRISTDDIRFVIVLGDLIQGELEWASQYQNQFNDVVTELSSLLVPCYIPMLGNHDEWCNLDGDPLPGTTIPKYKDYPGNATQAPEEIFETVFGPVYTQLATTLPGWTKQDDNMPITNPNPHVPQYPPIYFQNFAFEFGPCHFICLDFCSRKDFDNIVHHPIMGPIFGYADLHDFTTNDGTLNWLDGHLASLSTQQKQNIILFTHHPLIYKLRIIFIQLDGDNTFAFEQSEYTQLTNLLNSHGCNIIHWFSGHYHLKGSNWGGGMNIIGWHDTVINSDISIIPSTMICSEFGGNPIPPGTPGIINGVYSGNFEPNPNGSIAIVKVKASASNILPDPFISTIIGDNPDVVLYKGHYESGDGKWHFDEEVEYSSDLDRNNPNIRYQIRATIHNGGCQEANVKVNFTWAGFAVGWESWQDTGFDDCDDPNQYDPHNDVGDYEDPNKIKNVDIPSGETREVKILLDPNAIPGSVTQAHGCIFVKIEPQNGDIRLGNNLAQENIDVNFTKSAEIGKCKEIPIPAYNPTNISNGVILEVTPTEGRLWNATIVLPPDGIPPESWGTAYLVLCPILDPTQPFEVGDVENFRVIGRRADTGELIGGVEIASLIDDPPILEWAGNNGYASDGVEPDEGNAGTTFTFEVMYKDENNHAPASGYPLLYLFKGDEQIEGSPFVMNEEDPGDTVYANGKIYKYSIILTEPGNDYTYYFWARDKLGIGATGPATNVMSGPRVFGAIPPEFIVARIDNSIYYFPYDETIDAFGSPVLMDTLGPCTGSPKIDGRVVDFDNDGDFDFLIDTSTWYVDRIELIVYENTGTTFVPAWQETQLDLGAAWGYNSFVVAGDFDEDGDWDFLQSVINQTDSYTYDIDFYAWGNDWIPGGTLTFRPLLGFSIDTSPIAHPYDMESADFNNDGHLDLLIGDYPHGGVHVGEAYLYTGNGRWGFVRPASPCIEVNTPHPQPIPAMVSGDFYRGLLPVAVDVIVGLDDDGDPGQTFLFSNDGTGVFSQVTMFPPNPWTSHEPFDLNKGDEYPSYDRPGGGCMDAKDFNKDDVLDIVASGGIGFTNPLWYLRGLGSGTFGHACLIHHNAYLIAAPDAPDYVDPWTEINKELDELTAKVNAATMPSIIKRILVDKLGYAKTSVENAKIAHEAGNDAQAKKYLGLSKYQVKSFENRVKTSRRIKPEDKARFLEESAEIKVKIQALIEYIVSIISIKGDITGDGKPEVISTDGKELLVRDEKGPVWRLPTDARVEKLEDIDKDGVLDIKVSTPKKKFWYDGEGRLLQIVLKDLEEKESSPTKSFFSAWSYNTIENSVCWNAMKAERGLFWVDLDDDLTTAAVSMGGLWHTDWGNCVDIGVVRHLTPFLWQYGWAFRIGETNRPVTGQWISMTCGGPTEWFYLYNKNLRGPNASPDNEADPEWWAVYAKKGNSGSSRSPVIPPFKYSTDGGDTWNTMQPPPSTFFATGDNSGDVYIYVYNPTTANFDPRIWIGNIGGSCAGAAVADFDGNGFLDVIMANKNNPQQIYIFLNSAGMFSPPTLLTITWWNPPPSTIGYDVAAADFDNDGDIDYAFIEGDKLWVLYNAGSGLFWTGVNELTIPNCYTSEGMDAFTDVATGDKCILTVVKALSPESRVDLLRRHLGIWSHNRNVILPTSLFPLDSLHGIAAGMFRCELIVGVTDAIVGHDGWYSPSDPGAAWLYYGYHTSGFQSGAGNHEDIYDLNDPVDTNPGGGLGHVDAWDFDGDLKPELVATATHLGASAPGLGVFVIDDACTGFLSGNLENDGTAKNMWPIAAPSGPGVSGF